MKLSALFSALVVAALVSSVAPARALTQTQLLKKTYRNPIIDRIGPADPRVIRLEGKYYLYATLDGKGCDVTHGCCCWLLRVLRGCASTTISG